MKKYILLVLIGTSAQAANLNPMAVLKSNRVVTCYADDNVSVVLNSKRTAIKFTVEGESLVSRVEKVYTDNSTYVSYSSKEVKLTFNARGSWYRPADDDKSALVDCEFSR